MKPDEIQRYARHLMLKEIGGPGQRALLAASVTIIGAGALGGPCALYLAAAGVGRIEILDDDTVALSNLQRQVQFETADTGRVKVDALAQRLRALNPGIEIIGRAERFTAATDVAGEWLIDASDNFATRFALNELAHRRARPLISGAVGAWLGQVAVFDSAKGEDAPCYRCLVPEAPPQAETCAELGVVGALTGMIAARMALETIKRIAGAGPDQAGRLWVFDALAGEGRHVKLRKDPNCRTCRAV